MKKLSVLALMLFLAFTAFSQGTITGKITESVTGETLIGANVYITQNPSMGGNADLDGNYTIKNVPAGTYTVTASFISYDSKVIENVVVTDGQTTIVDFALGEDIQVIDGGAVVEVRQNKREDLYMMKERSKDAAPIDFRSAKDIQKSGDKDVGNALKRVTGVSTVGNYVFVRGLSDRYIKTTLNGHTVPTLDPRRNSIQMDIFPTGSVDNLVIRKGYTANLPGDWAGAYIDIRTRDFPDSLDVRYSVSLGYNDNATFNDVLTSETSSTDWLGYDNGYRDFSSDLESVDAVPQVYVGSYYEALVWAGYQQQLNDLGIYETSDIGSNGTMTIYQLVNQLDDFNSVEDVNVVLRELRAEKNGELSGQTQSFGNTWDPKRKRANMNMSHTLSIGNSTKLFGRRLGFNIGGQWNQKTQSYNDGFAGRYTLTGKDTEINQLNLERALTDQMGTTQNNWSVLGNLSYRLADNHNVKFVWMSTSIGTNEARYQNGSNPSDDPTLMHEQRMVRYTERQLNTFQLNGEHFFENFMRSKVRWGGAYTKGKEDTPDFRLFTNSYQAGTRPAIFDPSGNEITDQMDGYQDFLEYLVDEGEISSTNDPAAIAFLEDEYGVDIDSITEVADTSYSIMDNLYPSPTRFYRTMNDEVWNFTVDMEIPIHTKSNLPNKIQFGAARTSTSRDYNERRFTFVSDGVDYNGNPTDYFDPSNMIIAPDSTNYIYLRDDSDVQNSYTASMDVNAAYALVDWNVNNRLRVNVGARVEHTNMLTESDIILQEDLDETQLPNFVGKLDNVVNLLPSVMGTYQLYKNDEKFQIMNLRVGYSRTVARPSFREKSPYSAYDFATQEQVTGNPDLQMTTIDNVDLRLEFFPYIGEVISLSAFYKGFTNPIEQQIISTAANTEITWQNVSKAQALGLEFEIKKSLGMLGQWAQPLQIGGNVTLIKSQTIVSDQELALIRSTDTDHPDTRPMYGQSPYIINAMLSYEPEKLGLMTALSYNIQGPQLVLVTKGGTPDVYQTPRGSLDFTLSKSFGKHFNVGVKANNLLDQAYQKVYQYNGQDYFWSNYKLGRTYSLSLSVQL
ncbi:MAG: TonB-dependent receptor [Flavobacteriales bacterium]|nr:TonB-dependent receptor [Flavobacteriales bacterium]